MLVVIDDGIDITILEHYSKVDRTCHQHDTGYRKFFPQCTKQRNRAQHITKLVVLSDDKNAFEAGIRGESNTA